MNDDVLVAQWFALLHGGLGQLQSGFRQRKMGYSDLGAKLGVSPEQAKTLITGQTELSVEMMHKMARAMDFRLEISLKDLTNFPSP